MKTLVLLSFILMFFVSVLYSQSEFKNKTQKNNSVLEQQIQSYETTGNIDEQMLDSIIAQTMGIYHIPGWQGLIVKHNQIIWSKNFGYANIALNKPVEDSTLFLVASISKTIVATAIMQFWEADYFDLDDKINDYLTDFQVVNPNHQNDSITFRMLMTHTSSIRDNWDVLTPLISCGDSPIPLDTFLIKYFTSGSSYYRLSNFNSFSPFSNIYDYTNVGAALLAYFVEKFSGMSFNQYCRENIFDPLEMNKSSYLLSELDISSIAIPYEWKGSYYFANCQQGFPIYPIAQLRTNKIELEHFLSAYMNWGKYNDIKILDSTTIDLMLRDHVGHIIPKYNDIQGLIWYQRGKANGRYPWGHEGSWTYGTTTAMFFQQVEDWGIIFFMNIFYDTDGQVPLLILNTMCDYAQVYGHIYALNTNVNTRYLKPSDDKVIVTTNFSNINQHNFQANAIYISSDSTLIDSTELFDDGLHNDAQANDGIWGGFIPNTQTENFYTVGISTVDLQTGEYFITGNQNRFTTVGPLTVDSIAYLKIGNLYYIKPFVHNLGNTKTINNVTIRMTINDPWVISVNSSAVSIPDIAPGSLVGASGWLIASADSTLPGYFNIKFEMMSGGYVYWTDSVKYYIPGWSGIKHEGSVPKEYSLAQNFPNPFNPSTTIKYSIPELSKVKLILYNLLGESVTTLVNEEKPAGNYEIEFHAENLPSGVYFYQLKAGEFISTRKMILLK
jgi:CubicO group peptidase (beta-lactamase class C family)